MRGSYVVCGSVLQLAKVESQISNSEVNFRLDLSKREMNLSWIEQPG